MIAYDVLPGLPPYGDWPEAFTSTGHGRQHEGFVVRFNPDGESSWVGNFQRGLSSFDLVCEHLNGRELIVVAGGEAYVVDPYDRLCHSRSR